MTAAISSIYTPRYKQLMRQFPLRPIRTKKESQTATDILDNLFGIDHTDEGEAAYVYVLACLLEDYENQHESTRSEASGLDVLKHLIEETGVKQAVIAKLLGIRQSAVSMILSGNRPITAEHARRLGEYFSVNPGLFL